MGLKCCDTIKEKGEITSCDFHRPVKILQHGIEAMEMVLERRFYDILRFSTKCNLMFYLKKVYLEASRKASCNNFFFNLEKSYQKARMKELL